MTPYSVCHQCGCFQQCAQRHRCSHSQCAEDRRGELRSLRDYIRGVEGGGPREVHLRRQYNAKLDAHRAACATKRG